MAPFVTLDKIRANEFASAAVQSFEFKKWNPLQCACQCVCLCMCVSEHVCVGACVWLSVCVSVPCVHVWLSVCLCMCVGEY